MNKNSSFISHLSSFKRKTARFTLMELLITIGVIVILSAMLLPALTRAKGNAMKAVCISNMKQIGVYCQNYRDRMDGRYPQANYGYSWCYYFMFSEGVFKQFPHIARNEEKDLFGLRKKSGIAWCPAGEVRWISRGDDVPTEPKESTLKEPFVGWYDFSKFVHYGLLLPGDMGICSYRTNGPANGKVGVNTSLTEFAAAHNSYYISASDRQIRSPSIQAWMAESQFGDTSYADVEKIGYNKIRIAGNQKAGDPTRGVWGVRHGPAVNLLFCDGHVAAKLLDRLLEWGRRPDDERNFGYIRF